MKQTPCNPLPAIRFFRVNSTDVGCQILPVVKIILDDAQSADDPVAIHTQIPSKLSLMAEILFHARQIGFFRSTPFAVKPGGGRLFQLRPFPQGDERITILDLSCSDEMPFLDSGESGNPGHDGDGNDGPACHRHRKKEQQTCQFVGSGVREAETFICCQCRYLIDKFDQDNHPGPDPQPGRNLDNGY